MSERSEVMHDAESVRRSLGNAAEQVEQAQATIGRLKAQEPAAAALEALEPVPEAIETALAEIEKLGADSMSPGDHLEDVKR